MLEISGRFPSPDMIHTFTVALKIVPAELFYKELDPVETKRNTQKATIEDIGGEVNLLLTDFFTEKVRKLGGEAGGKGD